MIRNLFSLTLLATICLCCQETKTASLRNKQFGPSGAHAAVTDYIIKKGNHYSEQNQFSLIKGSIMAAWVTFDSSAIYSTKNITNQGDVNKLFGFSDCGTFHHQNSARLGWSWDGKEVVVYAYAYVNKLRVIKTLGAVTMDEAFSCSVSARNNYYYFKAAQYSDSIPRYCSGSSRFRYRLFPYFGGSETAPHEIRISILEE